MPDWFVTAVLVFARIGGLSLIVPGVQHPFVPWRMRFIVTVLLTVPILCVVPCAIQEAAAPSDLLGMLFREAILGVTLGLAPAAIFLGLQLATSSLHGMTGLSTEPAEPGLPRDALSRLFFIVTLTVFFAASGHRHVIQALLASFEWMPAGNASSIAVTRTVLVDVLAQSFHLGVRAAAPITAALAIGLLVLAALNKVIPQFGYFAVGMSVQTTVMLASLVILLGGIGMFLEVGFESTVENWQHEWLVTLRGNKP